MRQTICRILTTSRAPDKFLDDVTVTLEPFNGTIPLCSLPHFQSVVAALG